jgi:tetratricopeptide (TPR) repeat protein
MSHKIAPIPPVRSWSRWPVGGALALLSTLLLCIAPMAAARANLLSALRRNVGGSSLGVQQGQEVHSLEPGKPIERALSGGQSHSYQITMTSGQYLHLVVDQRGIDVGVVLFVPDGKRMREVDSTHRIEGSETVLVVTEATGTYRIEVCSSEKTAKTGRYEINVEELREATAGDKHRVAGESVFREAEQLQDGTVEAKRKSIEKYHQALSLYRGAGDRGLEAQTLRNIGIAYESFGELQKALEKLKEALMIFRSVGDRIGEARTLYHIGDVYSSLGEPQKALEKLHEALPITRAVGDRRVEAETLDHIGEAYFSLLKSDRCKASESLKPLLIQVKM